MFDIDIIQTIEWHSKQLIKCHTNTKTRKSKSVLPVDTSKWIRSICFVSLSDEIVNFWNLEPEFCPSLFSLSPPPPPPFSTSLPTSFSLSPFAQAHALYWRGTLQRVENVQIRLVFFTIQNSTSTSIQMLCIFVRKQYRPKGIICVERSTFLISFIRRHKGRNRRFEYSHMFHSSGWIHSHTKKLIKSIEFRFSVSCT